MFKKLYLLVLQWAEHPKARIYLFILSFTESSFFPIPPDVMLAPMCLAKPKKSMQLALITTLGSVFGGVLGYLLGWFAFDLIEPMIQSMGYQERFETVKLWFEDWGFWAIFIAGFSPIPYKLFTVSAGLMHMFFLPFLLASVIGRGARFFLVAALISYGGEGLKTTLNKKIELIGWVVSALIVLLLVYSQLHF